ncbi:unnamed protein product, partial [Iphiclides podalirius]
MVYFVLICISIPVSHTVDSSKRADGRGERPNQSRRTRGKPPTCPRRVRCTLADGGGEVHPKWLLYIA